MKSKTYIVRNKQDLDKLSDRMKAADISKPLRITVSVYRKSRTLAQNRLLWLWVECIQKHLFETTGEHYSTDDIHEFIKGKLLPTRVVAIGGEIKKVHKSTSDLNTMGMRDYLNDLDIYCGTVLELQLPHPDDYSYTMGDNNSE